MREAQKRVINDKPSALAHSVTHDAHADEKAGMHMRALGARRVTKLLDVSTIQTAVTQSIAKAKEIFAKAIKDVVVKVVQSIGTAINTTMASVKAELTTQADKAAAAATSGLDTLKSTLSQIPAKIKATCDNLHVRTTMLQLICDNLYVVTH